MTTQSPPVTLKQIGVWLYHQTKFTNISIQEDHVHFYFIELEMKVMIINDAITLRYVAENKDMTFESYEEFTHYMIF